MGGLEPRLSAAQAREALDGLPTTSGWSEVPYDRGLFGERWLDVDGNGCNQRDDVLRRDAVADLETRRQGDCEHDVVAGTWFDPYAQREVTFDDLKDPRQAEALTIDHVVPLVEAHDSGADRWPAQQRERFANDLDNLVAATEEQNSDKAGSDPAEWLPPEVVRCAYARVWVGVKDEWVLAVDDDERDALSRVLAAC